MPAAAPGYYPAVAPPPVTYSDPSPSWLGTATTFAGGAAVGGLVGWAIADDDDDDDDDGDRYSRGDIDIEDSTIVVNRRDRDELDDLQRQVQDEPLERAAREKAQREQGKLRPRMRVSSVTPASKSSARRPGGSSSSATPRSSRAPSRPAVAPRTRSPGSRRAAADSAPR